jgi:hypothetical protein
VFDISANLGIALSPPRLESKPPFAGPNDCRHSVWTVLGWLLQPEYERFNPPVPVTFGPREGSDSAAVIAALPIREPATGIASTSPSHAARRAMSRGASCASVDRRREKPRTVYSPGLIAWPRVGKSLRHTRRSFGSKGDSDRARTCKRLSEPIGENGWQDQDMSSGRKAYRPLLAPPTSKDAVWPRFQ